ncbi:alpha/beta fold hydrolase [Rhodococcus chondri]|uniref:Alpha/beta hydrolase n=1 Tax=Rhodococcus chondri TaxID=3065941 RepID=A0ABU7JRW2_9NOCA|nr:alpha/beta hydrolase [Rhodococcus sp. CC-R104]MEE2032760.1 alpha/beta hydrolase [Rhodococcus sp. CC-R104]
MDNELMHAPRLAHRRVGSGEPLLLLHGIGATLDDFSELIPRLSEHFEVLAIDLPGHGSSPMLETRPTIEALGDALVADLDAHGWDRVHVLGNSLGGRLAIELAKRGRALSVVALSPSGLGLPPERVFQGVLMAGARIANKVRSPLIERMSHSTAGRTALTAGLRAMPWRTTRTESLSVKGGFAESTGYWSMLWDSILMDVPTGLDKITCPVVLGQGVLDVVASAQTVRYTPLIPGSQFVPLPWAGHAPQSDTPDTIVDLVRRAATRAEPVPSAFRDQGSRVSPRA